MAYLQIPEIPSGGGSPYWVAQGPEPEPEPLLGPGTGLADGYRGWDGPADELDPFGTTLETGRGAPGPEFIPGLAPTGNASSGVRCRIGIDGDVRGCWGLKPPILGRPGLAPPTEIAFRLRPGLGLC